MNTAASTSFKARLKRRIKWPLISLVALLPDSVQSALFIPAVRKLAERVPVMRAVYTGCYRTHPIDRRLGTDTGGIFPPEPLFGEGLEGGNFPYMGCQPSIVRRALSQLGDLSGHTFIDVGCGKGRSMIVATEFPFDAVVGYDLAAPLVAIANANAKKLRDAHPTRVPMRAIQANALEICITEQKIVLFLFNPFGASVMNALMGSIKQAIANGSVESLHIVYIHPVCACILDDSPWLKRSWSSRVPYSPDELGYGSEDGQDVVIWRNISGFA